MKTSVCLTTVGMTLAVAAPGLKALELREFYLDANVGAALEQDIRVESDGTLF